MKSQNFLFFGDGISEFRNFVLKNHYNFDQALAHLLYVLGFRAHLLGVRFLRETIKCYYNLGAKAKVSFNKTIYPEVAKIFGTSAYCVERDIRNSINSCYYSGSLFRFNSIAVCVFVTEQYPPTNCEFIVQIAEWMHLQFDNTEEFRNGGGR